jgi:RNA polymerase sigma-70 factor, ECF subfamily
VATDFELLDAWAEGDPSAGDRLFRRHIRALYRFFRTKLDDGIDDRVQDTLVECVRARAAFRREAEFRTFMLATARNVLLNEYRRRRRHASPVDFSMHGVADLAPGPSTILASVDEQRTLLEALRSLPLDAQIVLELHYLERLTGPQLAHVLDIAEPAVRSRLRRAKEGLRARLDAIEACPPALLVADALQQWAEELRELIERS